MRNISKIYTKRLKKVTRLVFELLMGSDDFSAKSVFIAVGASLRWLEL
jgi:hypothetical protein